MTDHDHLWWHYFICEDERGTYKVFENPCEPVPEHLADGYECACGLSRLNSPNQVR